MPKVDIIIPVYKRAAVLRQVLHSLWEQEVPSGWEAGVIICDDGSPANIQEIITSADTPPLPWQAIKTIQQRHQGIAAARNRAIAASKADIVLLLGGDIVLTPGSLAAHLHFHSKHPERSKAALGYVVWDPRLNPSPFLEWMAHGGPQNNFDELLGETSADPRHFFYGSHISLKRSLIADVKFRPGYEPYGWEDLDMGYQLVPRGLTMTVLHEAVGHHHHHYDAQGIFDRQYASGMTVGQFIAINTPHKPLLITSRRRARIYVYRFLGLGYILRLFTKHYGWKHPLPRVYSLVTTAEFWRGVIRAKKLKSAT